MAEKLDLYDLLAALIPGTLLICVVSILFPAIMVSARGVHLPDAFTALALVVLAVFAGHTIEALSSVLEKVMEKTWGGRPSACLVQGRCDPRRFPPDCARRVKEMLAERFGPRISDTSVFQYAMQIAETSGNKRVERFNALYGYHRGVVVLLLLSLGILVASMFWGAASHYSRATSAALAGFALALLVLFWHRTKQRGYHYAGEVLLTAERVLESRTASSGAIASGG